MDAVEKPGPSAYGVGQFDLTGHIGPLFPEGTENPTWPMYSFSGPSLIIWNAIGKAMAEAGWPDKRIKEWLQSKNPRWALDGCLGENLQLLGQHYATEILSGRQS